MSWLWSSDEGSGRRLSARYVGLEKRPSRLSNTTSRNRSTSRTLEPEPFTSDKVARTAANASSSVVDTKCLPARWNSFSTASYGNSSALGADSQETTAAEGSSAASIVEVRENGQESLVSVTCTREAVP